MRLSLALAISVFFFVQSQPPSPTPHKTTNTNQPKTAPKQNEENTYDKCAKDLASPVNQPPPPITPSNQHYSANQGVSKTSPDWWAIASTILITIFTGALAFLAYLQWQAMNKQATYMREGLDETKKAYDLAFLNAKSAVRSERAYLNVKHEQLGDSGRWFQFNVTNQGRTPAEITYHTLKHAYTPTSDNLPMPPSSPNQELIHHWSIGAQETIENIHNLDVGSMLDNDQEMSVAVYASKKRLMIWGVIIYKDILDEFHETRFCYLYVPQSAYLQISGPPGYNAHT